MKRRFGTQANLNFENLLYLVLGWKRVSAHLYS